MLAMKTAKLKTQIPKLSELKTENSKLKTD